jgi:F-type H+-transporting ATPase subunit alpha
LILAEQVAIVYAGTKGYLDELPVEKVSEFVRELREYLKSSQAEYINAVQTEKVLSDASEATLKAAIKEVVAGLMVAA